MAVLEIGFGVLPGAEFATHLAAVDKEGGAGDVAGPIAGEEDGGFGDFVGLAAAAEWDGAEVVLDDVGRVKGGLGKAGADEAGVDGVNTDAKGAKFVGGGVEDAEHAGFGGVVGDEVLFAVIGIRGSGEDNGAGTVGGFHAGGGLLQRFEGGGEVEREGLVPDFAGGVLQRFDDAGAGVDEEGVGDAGVVEGRLEAFAGGDVAVELVAGEVDVGVRVDVEDVDIGGAGGQAASDGAADAMGAAGDDGGFAFE